MTVSAMIVKNITIRSLSLYCKQGPLARYSWYWLTDQSQGKAALRATLALDCCPLAPYAIIPPIARCIFTFQEKIPNGTNTYIAQARRCAERPAGRAYYSFFEKKGLKLVGMKMMQLDDALLDEHYSHLSHLPFFGDIKKFMMLAPVIATCWEGVDCIETVRRICGVTKSREQQHRAPFGAILA